MQRHLKRGKLDSPICFRSKHLFCPSRISAKSACRLCLLLVCGENVETRLICLCDDGLWGVVRQHKSTSRSTRHTAYWRNDDDILILRRRPKDCLMEAREMFMWYWLRWNTRVPRETRNGPYHILRAAAADTLQWGVFLLRTGSLVNSASTPKTHSHEPNQQTEKTSSDARHCRFPHTIAKRVIIQYFQRLHVCRAWHSSLFFWAKKLRVHSTSSLQYYTPHVVPPHRELPNSDFSKIYPCPKPEFAIS